jgi:hypothetical protein
MFIKWTRHRYGERVYCEALLVRAVRVEGKPRQEIIARLGSFTVERMEECRDDPWPSARAREWDPRCQFWRRATTVLRNQFPCDGPEREGLKRDRRAVRALNLDEATLARLEAQLAAVVPRPPAEEPVEA